VVIQQERVDIFMELEDFLFAGDPPKADIAILTGRGQNQISLRLLFCYN
jgi:hypothetical protein